MYVSIIPSALTTQSLYLQGIITFTLEELKGVPSDVVSGYTKRTEDGKDVYDVTYKTPDIFPLVSMVSSIKMSNQYLFMQFKYAESPVVRQRAVEGFESRLSINVDLLDKVLELRRQIAKLLGYNTWADYITEIKMVKSGAGVKQVCSSIPALHDLSSSSSSWMTLRVDSDPQARKISRLFSL